MSQTLYRGMDAAALEREYNARDSVPDFDTEFAAYQRLSGAAAAGLPHTTYVYDAVSGEALDIYPAAPGSPVFMWLHGGYWRSLSKADNAFIAGGLVPEGISVVIPDYTLAPAATLAEITRQVGAALAWVVRHTGHPARIHVGGSSAGGHLAAALLTSGRMAALGLPADTVASATVVSGLFDLEPLRHCSMNAWLRMDAAAARRHSPLFDIQPNSPAQLIASHGGRETAEFARQTAAYVDAWHAAGNRGSHVAMPDHNHFDIAVALATPGTALNDALIATIHP